MTEIERTAVLTADGLYRYRLTRVWDPDGPNLDVVMLNPSTADGTSDDPTSRKVVKFATRWGYGRVTLSNVFALIATDPARLPRAADPIGPENRSYLEGVALRGDTILCAWGTGAERVDVDWTNEVAILLRSTGRAHVLGVTQEGHPGHPLYVRDATDPLNWSDVVAAGRRR